MEQELEGKMKKLEKKDEEDWRIKSQSLWLKARNKNTTFFHNHFKETMTKKYCRGTREGGGQEYNYLSVDQGRDTKALPTVLPRGRDRVQISG